MKTISLFSISSFVAALFLCCTTSEPKQDITTNKLTPTTMDTNKIDTATFGAGCFWCIEACYKELKGVIDVFPGYAGGQSLNPTYEQVCGGQTGHAEVARVIYDDALISFEELLEVYWFVHDPTQLNRQGNDIGTQYRSVIFYHDE